MVNDLPLKFKTKKRVAVQSAATLFLFALLLSACSEIAVRDLDPDSYGGTIVPPPGGGGNATVKFSTDITPILNSKCGTCHVTGSTIAPNPDLKTTGATLYATVQPIASTLLTATSSLHPSGAGQIAGMTDADRTKITTWVAEGAQNN